MEKFAKVIQDAERHLEFAERSASDLDRRIQEISRAITIAERNVEESITAIAASEKNLSILAGQQSDTRKKLSVLYQNLISIPTTVPNSSVDLTSSSSNVPAFSKRVASREAVVFRLCLFNALTATREVTCLVRHTHFVQSGLRQVEEAAQKDAKTQQHTQSVKVMSVIQERGRMPVDAIVPLCLYALSGTCTDKNCCFQHLEESISSSNVIRKSTRSGRTWRSLQLQKYLKQQHTNVIMNCHISPTSPQSIASETACGLNDDISQYTNTDINISHYQKSEHKDAADKTINPSAAKRRYFDCFSEIISDAESTAVVEGEKRAPLAISVKNTALLGGQWGLEECVSHCLQLWASCEVESVCDCIYKCLQIKTDSLPFHSFNNKLCVNNFPSSLQDFASSEKTQRELNTLYACLVYLIVTGDYLGNFLLGKEGVEERRSRSDIDSDVPIVRLFFLSWPRKQLALEKLTQLLDHAPHLFKKIVSLLQLAHDSMKTCCVIKYTTNALHFPVAFSYSCCSGPAKGSVEEEKEDVPANTRNGTCASKCKDVNKFNYSLAHQVIWLCTELLAEVCLLFEPGGHGVKFKEMNRETAALLVNICADARIPLSCKHKLSPAHGGNTPSNYLSQYLQNLNIQSIAPALHLISLSQNTIAAISKQFSLFDKCGNHHISDRLVLAVLTNSYLCRAINFKTYLTNMLTTCANSRCSGSAYADNACPSVVFSCGGKTWELSASPSTSYEEYANRVSLKNEDIFCHFTLLPHPHGSGSGSGAEYNYSGDSSGDIDKDSDSGGGDKGSLCPVLSQIELRHMLQDVMLHIFSLQIQSSQTSNGIPNISNDSICDADTVIFIWLCIAKVCSSFDPPIIKSQTRSVASQSKSVVNGDSIMMRFFSNSLVVQREYVQKGPLSIDNCHFVTSNSVDVVGAVLLRFLFVFCHEKIQKISNAMASVNHSDVSNLKGLFDSGDSFHDVCCLLSLVISVIVTVQYSHLQGNKASVDFISSPPSPLSNIYQSTLYSILKELRAKKMLSLNHIEHLLSFLQKGRTNYFCHGSNVRSGDKMKMSCPAEEIFSEFFVLFPVVHPIVLRNCFTYLLTSDVLDLCFEMLDDEASDNNSRFYQFTNTPSIERLCLKYAQYLTFVDMMPLRFLHPDTLFQLAIVYFVAENFDGLMVVQRTFLEMKHPLAMFNFSRVFSVCFEYDSLSCHLDVVSALLGDKASCHAQEGSAGTPVSDLEYGAKRRRVLSCAKAATIPWTTFQPEAISLLQQYSLDVLVSLSESLVNFVPTNANDNQIQNTSIDLTSFSTNGLIPAFLTVLAEKSRELSPLVSMNMSHNNLAIFPHVILDISSLVRLDLSWNKLSSMPSGIDKLSHLQVLNISHNLFVYFPSSVLKLKASLLELYLQDNKLEEIRNDFLKLSHLQVLDVSNNRLKNIPSRLSSHIKLKFFRFSGNPIFDTFAASSPHGQSQGLLKFSSTRNMRLSSKKNNGTHKRHINNHTHPRRRSHNKSKHIH